MADKAMERPYRCQQDSCSNVRFSLAAVADAAAAQYRMLLLHCCMLVELETCTRT